MSTVLGRKAGIPVYNLKLEMELHARGVEIRGGFMAEEKGLRVKD